MMTPMHTDLIKHTAPALPTADERAALRAHRQARRAAFLALVGKVLALAPRRAPRRATVSQPF